MKENALAACSNEAGGARTAVDLINKLPPDVEIHIVGHSAGAIFHAPIVEMLAKAGRGIRTCTLWAPACSVRLFKQSYLTARHHGDFDHDEATVKATLARMVGAEELKGEFNFTRTKSSLRKKREFLAGRS